MDAMKKNSEIIIFPSRNDLYQFAAKDFYHRAISAVNNKGIFSVVLAGGKTPQLFFDTLSSKNYQKNIPWQKIQFFFGDERYVPADDLQSNYHMANEHLFSRVPVNPDQIFRIPTDFNDPKEAAENYEQTLRKVFHTQENAFPPFDVVYLGLGENAHTASLMPFSEVVIQHLENPLPEKNKQLVTSLFVTTENRFRITLTPNAIDHSNDIIFLVTGSNKANAVFEVLEGQTDPLHYPAQLIQSASGKTFWFLDQAAAKKL